MNGREVASQVDRYLNQLITDVAPADDECDRQIAAHINQTFRNRWWGLFTCYEIPGLPRTNNEMETFLRRLKTGQRRVTGRKKVNDFIVRYGRLVAFLDASESQADLLARLRQVPYEDFLRERKQLSAVEQWTASRHRFRHKRAVFFRQLEDCWTALSASI